MPFGVAGRISARAPAHEFQMAVTSLLVVAFPFGLRIEQPGKPAFRKAFAELWVPGGYQEIPSFCLSFAGGSRHLVWRVPHHGEGGLGCFPKYRVPR